MFSLFISFQTSWLIRGTTRRSDGSCRPERGTRQTNCNVLEGAVPSGTKERTDDPSDSLEYFVLDGPELVEITGGTNPADHDYHILEAPEPLPRSTCDRSNQPLSRAKSGPLSQSQMEEVCCIAEESENNNASSEIEEIDAEKYNNLETPLPLEHFHFDEVNRTVPNFCVTANATSGDLAKHRDDHTKCEPGEYVSIIKHGGETSVDDKLCNQPCCMENGYVTVMDSSDDVCMQKQAVIDIKQNRSKAGRMVCINEASPLGTYNRQRPLLSAVTTEEEFF